METTKWLEIWETLKKEVAYFQSKVTASECASLPAISHVNSLLSDLLEFGGKLIDFFAKNIDRLDVPSITSESLFSGIIDNAYSDFDLFQRIFYQRCLGSVTMKDILAEADIQGKQALESAKVEADVLAYFHKSPSSRIIPYGNIALVGIPYSVTSNPSDMLSIYHEVGHFVYWRGGIFGKPYEPSVELKLLGQPAYLRNWAEEIFADLFGVYTKGEAYIRSGMERWGRSSLSEFVDSDKDHPAPILRPKIAALGLLRLVEGAAETALKHDLDWKVLYENIKSEYFDGNENYLDGATKKISKFRITSDQYEGIDSCIRVENNDDLTQPINKVIAVIAEKLKEKEKVLQTPEIWIDTGLDNLKAAIDKGGPNKKLSSDELQTHLEAFYWGDEWIDNSSKIKPSESTS